MKTALLIKFILMIAFFVEVVIFGKYISNLKCFNKGQIMSAAMTFSGSLFLSIAMLDIIPEAIAGFDAYFTEIKTSLSSSSSLHSNQYLPLTMIIACITFMVIMYIDKILIDESHDHQYEVSFTMQPKKSDRENAGIQIKDFAHMNQANPNTNKKIEQKINGESCSYKNSDDHLTKQKNYRPFILQLGMSIHAFFQCLAVGLQKTPIGVLSLAVAIFVHKWAEGLTLGLIYKKQGYSKKMSTIMVIFQGFVNVLGLLTGTLLIGQGHFVIAFFRSISAGTFLYISLGQVLNQQIKEINKRKMFAMLFAITFISGLVWLEKYSEEISQEKQN